MSDQTAAETTQSKSVDTGLLYINQAQYMAYDMLRIYQNLYKNQQQLCIEYWTQIIKNTYNPWK